MTLLSFFYSCEKDAIEEYENSSTIYNTENKVLDLTSPSEEISNSEDFGDFWTVIE